MAKHSEKGETPTMEAKAHKPGFLKAAAAKSSRFGKHGSKHGSDGKHARARAASKGGY